MMRWNLVALGAVLVVYPFLVSDPYFQRVGVLVLLAALSGSAWNLVGGYAGQISIGHAAYYGIGAYVPLVLYDVWGTPLAAGIPVAMALSAILAVIVGMPTFRLYGHYFTMATIALAEIIRRIAENWELVGASRGLSGPILGRSIWDLSFQSPRVYYYIFLVSLAIVLFVTYRLERSRAGYYLRAIRANERAARSLGVPIQRYKLVAFALSVAFTSLAGSYYAAFVLFIDPPSVLHVLVSVEMVIVSTLGGVGTLFGPFLGAAILVPLKEWTNTLLGGAGSGVSYVVYGAVIMLIAAYEPAGLVGLWRQVSRRWGQRRREVQRVTARA